MPSIPGDRVFCDTSFFYASLDINETTHHQALQILDICAKQRVRFFTTWEIISETVTLLRYRLSYNSAVRFIDEVIPEMNIIQITPSMKVEALRIFKRYNQDKRISFCDILSYLVVTQQLERIPSLAFDPDFEQLGLTVIKAGGRV